MQQILNWTRRLVYPAAAILLILAGYMVLASPYTSKSDGKILAVYDAESSVEDCDKARDMTPDKENVSSEALAGFCRAVRAGNGPNVDPLNVHDELSNPSDIKTAKIYERLASRVARGSTLGVISFLSSPDSAPVVRFCRTMEIPLLLTLAANNDLLAPTEDTTGIVFRMMPNNGRQATDMAAWVNDQVHDRSGYRIAVFHEPNTYGEFLQQRLNYDLRPNIREKGLILYNFEVTEELQFAGLLPQLMCEKIDLIVYLGYASRAMDLLNKLRWYRADPDTVACRAREASRRESGNATFSNIKVLLSSGAYDDDLNDPLKYPFAFQIFALLPTRPPGGEMKKPSQAVAAPDGQESGAYEYGYDSYAVLQSLAAQKFSAPSQPLEHSMTGHDYRFDGNGELTPVKRNTYVAYPLGSSARKP